MAGTPPQALEIEVRAPSILLAGDLDGRSTERLRRSLYDVLADHERVVVDLSRVENADLAALKVLAAATRVAAWRHREVRLLEPPDVVVRLLHCSRLMRCVRVDRAAAAV